MSSSIDSASSYSFPVASFTHARHPKWGDPAHPCAAAASRAPGLSRNHTGEGRNSDRFRGAGLASRTGHTHPRQRTPARGDFYGRYSNVSSGHVAPSATS